MYLYISASEEAISVVLICQREHEQIPIYYHSRRLKGAETRYPLIERLVYAVVHAASQFRTYFLALLIKVFTEYLFRRYLHKPETLRRLTRWAIELSEFRIDYVLATTIKEQAVVDFIVELMQVDQNIPWIVEVDGSSCSTIAGLGIKVITLDQRIREHLIRLHFTTSNNIVESEVAINGLKIAKMLGATFVKLRTDSQLLA